MLPETEVSIMLIGDIGLWRVGKDKKHTFNQILLLWSMFQPLLERICNSLTFKFSCHGL